MRVERRDPIFWPRTSANRKRDEPVSEAKPYDISKRLVWEAWKQVKENRGAAGVDGVSLAMFEKDLKRNLYKIWNRMSSGSYFPPSVRLVEIPKANGGVRPPGIPTVADRVAQTVVKMVLEPRVEPLFHPDSYGYRPGRSALDAVGAARERCWTFDWVIDLDIKSFFDTIPHDLIEKAVARHADLAWVNLYVRRWLRAPVAHADGTLTQRTRGTPQGSVVSPLLANLFLHYAFDVWMQRTLPGVRFERYADDVIVHCRSERQARSIIEAIRQRFAQCGLELHPGKTRIVYCKNDRRRKNYEQVTFDFLGYTTLHDSLPSRRDFAPCLDRAGRFVEDPFSQLIEAGPEPRLGAITVGLPADFASPDKDRGGLAGPGDSERHQRKKGVELGGDDEARVLEVEPAGLGVAEEALDGPAFLVRV